jgi:hypothetical protein
LVLIKRRPSFKVGHVDKPPPNAPDVRQTLPPRPLKFEVADFKLNKTGKQDYLEATRGGLRDTNLSLVAMLGLLHWLMGPTRGTIAGADNLAMMRRARFSGLST